MAKSSGEPAEQAEREVSIAQQRAALEHEVEQRFGVLPNFFRLLPENPDVTANLWGFAKFAYLDNPLPSLFKERLFVYLSRFCEVRYCITRHVGFLAGLGHSSGDAECPPQTVEEIIGLIRRPFPRAEHLKRCLSECATWDEPLRELPPSGSAVEEAIFACASHAFLQTADGPKCVEALKRLLGDSRFQHLTVFLAFVRTAHYWTKLHPELRLEEDIKQLLATHETLAQCLLNDPESSACAISEKLLDELVWLRAEGQQNRELSREHEELLQAHRVLREVDLKQAEEAKAILASIVESSDDAIISKDLNGTITSWNRAAERLYGYTAREAIGQPVTMLIPSDRLDEEPRILEQIRRGERVDHFETVRTRKDGSRLDISLTISPIRDPQGSIVGASKIARDITGRKQAQEQLRRSHDTFYNLVENNPFGIYVVDSDFRLRQVSKGSQKVFSNVRPLLGRDFAEVLRTIWPEPFASETISRFRHTLDTGEPYRSASTIERRHDIPETESYDWKIERIVLPNGQFGVVCYFYDMTERQRAEAALRQSEERFRSLVSVITDVPWVRDASGAFIAPQPAWETYTGQTWEKYRGFGWLNALYPDDQDRVKDAWAKAHASHKPYEFQGRMWHAPTKEWRHFVARGTPLFDADGSVREWVGSCTDVETEKRAEEASRRIEQLAAAGRMAAVVAHEINNPLEAVVNCWYLLAKEKMSPQGRKFLTLAGDELDRIMHIARQTLTFYRAPSRPDAVDVPSVIEEALQYVRMRWNDVPISLDYRDAGLANGHEAELRQVALNVLMNAVEAGSTSIKVRVSRSVDWQNRQRRGVRITISDDGKGVPKSRIGHIFEPFYTTKEAKGTGLGLWVSNGIVVKHGGSMKVRSNAEPGRSGTVVSIFLQAATAPVQPAIAAIEPKVAV